VHGWRGWIFDPRLLIIIGILLGIGLGLFVGWNVWAVSYYNTDIYDLRADYQDDYVVMVGALYALEQHLETSQYLLSLLSNPQTPRSIETIVVQTTERYIARGADPTDIRYLVRLAQALGNVTTPMQPYLDGQQP
jgi:hypothetical protein